MTSPSDNARLHELEVEVDAELTLTESSEPEEGLPVEQWQFDPIDVQREEAGLRNLLGAVRSIDGGLPRLGAHDAPSEPPDGRR